MNRKDFEYGDRKFVGWDGAHEQTVVSYTDDEIVVSVSKTRTTEITLLRLQVVNGEISKVEDRQWDEV